MRIKIEQFHKAFERCLNHIDNEWKITHTSLPSLSEVAKFFKNQMNIKYINMGGLWDDDILEFESEEDYFLFLIRWL